MRRCRLTELPNESLQLLHLVVLRMLSLALVALKDKIIVLGPGLALALGLKLLIF